MSLPESIQTISDIDWPELRKRALAQKTRTGKSAKEWDNRAKDFARRGEHSPYIELVLKHLPPLASTSVLDIGCGPGTLAIPIAKTAGKVTALDFSAKMLELLRERSAEEQLHNITTAHLSWEDDWHQAGIGRHDITLASRSTALQDMPMALRKLDRFAQKAVFLTDRVNPTPFEPEAFAAIGARFNPGPDYIYTLNILHSMGIAANVTLLEFDREKKYPDMEEALAGLLWMFDEITEKQLALLRGYLDSICNKEADGSITVTRPNPPRWALISWEKKK